MSQFRVRTTAVAAIVAAVAASASTTAGAFDARSLALGGSTIADGRGLQGAVQNPASLAAMQRRGERGAFALGAAADLRDHGDVADVLLDGFSIDDELEGLGSDIEDEIDRLSGATVTCDPFFDADDRVCITGTAELGRLSGEGLEILRQVDEEPIEGLGEGRVGFALASTPIPFALHIGARGTATGVASISDGDIAYVNDLQAAFEDDELTVGELNGTVPYAIDGTTLTIAQPEDIISSTGRGGVLRRVQMGVGVAMSLAVGKKAIDVGVTPKLSRLTAWALDAEFRDAFDSDTPSLITEFEDSETSESSFTFDAGAAMDLVVVPVRIAAVLRNVVPESIETPDGFEFETTPQLMVGASLRRGLVGFTSDLALNNAKLDGIETQPFAIGVEFGQPLFALRGGLSADLAREDDQVAITLGAKLGPLEIGGRVSGLYQGSIGAQLALTF